MKIVLITDVWQPHSHAVVEVLSGLVHALNGLGQTVEVLHPGGFRSRPAPLGWGMDWALAPAKRMNERLDELRPDVLHIATEGPLGWAARQWALRENVAFTTASWVDLPQWLGAMLGCPQRLGAAWQRWFHRPAAAVLVPCASRAQRLTRHYGVARVRVWTPGVDIMQFAFVPDPVPNRWLGPLPRPVSLCVAHEGMCLDEMRAVLALDLPGSLVVCRAGRWRARLEREYPYVHWLDDVAQTAMPEVYASADVVVQPGQGQLAQTLALQAMACGTPVAGVCLPEGTNSRAWTRSEGGGPVADDLHGAVARALTLPRHHARFRALPFNWPDAARQFLELLIHKKEHQLFINQASGKYFV
jgi:glycosyltransferase involved in cell wall biosynthesis